MSDVAPGPLPYVTATMTRSPTATAALQTTVSPVTFGPSAERLEPPPVLVQAEGATTPAIGAMCVGAGGASGGIAHALDAMASAAAICTPMAGGWLPTPSAAAGTPGVFCCGAGSDRQRPIGTQRLRR